MPSIVIPLPTTLSGEVNRDSYLGSMLRSAMTFPYSYVQYPALEGRGFLKTSTRNLLLSSLASYTTYTCTLKVYKGIKPTLEEWDADYHTSMASRSTDLLMSTSAVGTSGLDITNKEIISTIDGVAIATAILSGEATWWTLKDGTGTHDHFVGDASNEAGTGELKFVDANIVAGQDYTLTAFIIKAGLTIQL